LIADGGIREYGDIAKAIGAGAQMVMIGGLFAGCSETPGDYVQGKKIYRGMASDGAMRKIRTEDNLPTPEGTSVLIDAKGSAGEIVNAMAGGLRSAMSYSNALTIEQMNYRAKFGIKRSGMIR
jgi:IMP dehydrogenase